MHEGVRERLISIPRGTHFQVSSRSEKVWKEGAWSNRKRSQFASISHYCVRRQAESRRWEKWKMGRARVRLDWTSGKIGGRGRDVWQIGECISIKGGSECQRRERMEVSAELTDCRIFAEDKCRTANQKIVGWTDLGILCKSMRQSNTKDFSLGGRPWRTASKPSKHGQVSLTRTPCRPHNKLRRR